MRQQSERPKMINLVLSPTNARLFASIQPLTMMIGAML